MQDAPDKPGPADHGEAGPARAVAIGASAGGVEALLELVDALEPGVPAPVLVTLHQPADVPTVLPQLLGRRSGLPAAHARDGETLESGRIYVAPPDHHLTIDKSTAVVSRGPKENGHRPAIDPLLRSLALHIGHGAVGVVLSGALDDGASGLLDLVRHGGTAMVQAPEDALYPSMPRAALEQVPGAVVGSARELGVSLGHVLEREVLTGGTAGMSTRLSWEVGVVQQEVAGVTDRDLSTSPAGLACPDCSGPLFELPDGGFVRYRCRVGHAWSQRSLMYEQDRSVESALYTALRVLEDKVALQRRVAATAELQGAVHVVSMAEKAADEAAHSAAVLRRLLGSEPGAPASGPAGDGRGDA